MKKFSTQFKKQADIIRMRASERSALKERLLTYMEYHPVSKEVASQKNAHVPYTVTGKSFKIFSFHSLYARSFAGVFVLFLILSVPVVAEKALPGDVLYPVKVQFNEELRSTLSLSPYEKVAWETQRLERRISEARLLASEGKLTDEAETQFAQAVKTHSEAAQREIAELRESDSEEAAIAEMAFASALAVQSEVLEDHIEKDTQNQNSDDGRSVVVLAEVVAQARTSAEATQTGILSYEKLLGRIEQESTHVYELFESVKNEASVEEVINVERRLADIQRKVAEAIVLKEDKTVVGDEDTYDFVTTDAEEIVGTTTEQAETSSVDFIELVTASTSEESAVETATTTVVDTQEKAVELLRFALTDLQKLLSYLTHLDVRQSVSIDDLVPLTPTVEEQEVEMLKLLEEVQEDQSTSTDEIVVE